MHNDAGGVCPFNLNSAVYWSRVALEDNKGEIGNDER